VSSGSSTQRRGFTLIELIVVIAIIATLASLVAPSVFRNTGDAKITAARAQVEMLGIALETYRLDAGSYPSTTDGLHALVERPVGSASPNTWRGPYLKRAVPLDPWGRPYVYGNAGRQSGGTLEYELSSLGRDGREGGEGEDADVTAGIGKTK
jgi:general secretion pathway protein G